MSTRYEVPLLSSRDLPRPFDAFACVVVTISVLVPSKRSHWLLASLIALHLDCASPASLQYSTVLYTFIVIMVSGPDASNSSLPSQHPVMVSVPPVPTCVRGERCALTGSVGRLNADKPCLVYASQKGVVCCNLDDPAAAGVTPLLPHINKHLPVLVYRGHAATVTAVSVSPSGAYCATGDSLGHLKVWALDHAEHLCKYEMPCCLTGPIRDLDWDGESKRIGSPRGNEVGNEPLPFSLPRRHITQEILGSILIYKCFPFIRSIVALPSFIGNHGRVCWYTKPLMVRHPYIDWS